MPDLVVVDRLVKRYGPRVAVRGVSLTIEEGEVIGLLGPNGSGKSTILRVLAGYLPPSAGSVRIAGIDVAGDSLGARRQVGYVPEDAPIYDAMRVAEFLYFMAAIIEELHGIAKVMLVVRALLPDLLLCLFQRHIQLYAVLID